MERMFKSNVFSIILAVILPLIVAGAFFYFDFWQEREEKGLPQNLETQQSRPETVPEETPEETPEEKTQPETQMTENRTLVIEDGFTVDLPQGWYEVSPPADLPAKAMAMNLEEEITNEEAKEAGFQTYFTVNYTDLKEYSLPKYIETVQNYLAQSIPGIEFTHTEQIIINGYDIHFLETKSQQNEISFKTLLAFFEGKNNIVWAFSFNALEESWPDHKETFYQIAKNFRFNEEK